MQIKRKTTKNKSNAVTVVVADGSAATATPGHSTELLHPQQQLNKIKISHLATIRSHQSHRTCPAHAFAHTKELLSDAAMLSGCSDVSTNSSEELLDVEDDKIAPIFEEDIDEIVDEEEEDEDNDDGDEEDDDEDDGEDIDEEEEEEDEDEGENDDDDEEDVECVEIDVERDDMEFCGTSRKSTYSVKSSVSRYDKLLTLAAPKQPAVMPTSQSFNDNSNTTNTKLQQLKQKKQLKEEHKVQRWRGKFKVDKVKNYSTEQQQQHADKKSSTIAGGSQKNIVKRALLSLASGSSSGTRPKSTSSLKFGHNKLHFLAVGHKSNKTKHKQEQLAALNNELTTTTKIISTDAEDANMEAEAAAVTTVGTTTTATTSTTKSNLGNIITSLLRTTTL